MAKMEQTYWIKIELTKPLHLNFLMRAKKWMNGSPNEQLWPQRPTPHVNIKPTEISKIQIQKKQNKKTTMSTGHQMLTYAICTHQQKNKNL